MKVRAPTLANVQTVAKMLEDGQLADLPIVIAAIDPCFSCTDRITLIKKTGSRSAKKMRWDELHTYSIEWYRKQGLDFTKLNEKLKKGT